MEFLVENWYVIVWAIAVTVIVGYGIYVFAKKPTSAQLEGIKEWLLWAVIEAEKELGSGTGQLKLRYVYNMFIERFGYLANVVTFDIVSMLVDEALDKMRSMLEQNKAVKDYVAGSDGKE